MYPLVCLRLPALHAATLSAVLGLSVDVLDSALRRAAPEDGRRGRRRDKEEKGDEGSDGPASLPSSATTRRPRTLSAKQTDPNTINHLMVLPLDT
jgi:hypothetical protein